MKEEYLTYNQKKTIFPDGQVEIIKYGYPKMKTFGKKKSKKVKLELTKEEKEKQKVQQAFRIKRKIKNYCLSNNFDLFWTLTFNDNEVNAFDYIVARKTLQSWLKYQREKYGKFDYIFVPELHKSGRIHFHGLTKNISPPLIEATNPKTEQKIKKNGKQIYNAENWKKGFSTVSKIDNNAKTASYITKYITKELLEMPTGYYQPHYFVSRGLKLPNIAYEYIEHDNLAEFIPSFIAMNINIDTYESEKIISIYKLYLDENNSFSQREFVETTIKSKLINNITDNEEEQHEQRNEIN